jgi:SAM-dependent methyltransferase
LDPSNLKYLFKEGSGYQLSQNSNVIQFMNPEFKNGLSAFLDQFKKIRIAENISAKKITDYKNLPFSKEVKDDFEWKHRKSSLKIIEKEIAAKVNLNILEIGSWNSWLTNRLAKKHKVIAVDYFIDETDGLLSKNNYKGNWTSIQMDIAEVNVFAVKFDLIIINHCLQFFADPIQYLDEVKKLLNPYGQIIIIGLSIYSDSKNKEIEVAKFKEYYQKKYSCNILLRPSKGFIDKADRTNLEKNNFKLYRNNYFFARNFYASLRTIKPVYYWAKYQF